MPKITEIFAFVVADKDADDEGVMGASMNVKGQLTMMPLVAADRKRLDSLRAVANKIKKESGKPYRILKFKLEGEIT